MEMKKISKFFLIILYLICILELLIYLMDNIKSNVDYLKISQEYSENDASEMVDNYKIVQSYDEYQKYISEYQDSMGNGKTYYNHKEQKADYFDESIFYEKNLLIIDKFTFPMDGLDNIKSFKEKGNMVKIKINTSFIWGDYAHLTYHILYIIPVSKNVTTANISYKQCFEYTALGEKLNGSLLAISIFLIMPMIVINILCIASLIINIIYKDEDKKKYKNITKLIVLMICLLIYYLLSHNTYIFLYLCDNDKIAYIVSAIQMTIIYILSQIDSDYKVNGWAVFLKIIILFPLIFFTIFRIL